jgi:hypothetical protein
MNLIPVHLVSDNASILCGVLECEDMVEIVSQEIALQTIEDTLDADTVAALRAIAIPHYPRILLDVCVDDFVFQISHTPGTQGEYIVPKGCTIVARECLDVSSAFSAPVCARCECAEDCPNL